MPKAKAEPLIGSTRASNPPAQLLGDEEVEALVAKKEKVRKRRKLSRVETPDAEEDQ